jgi:hypothetical protein
MQGNPGGMAGFPDPAPNRYRHSYGDIHSLTTPALAHAAATHRNLYPPAHSHPPAVCHAVPDTISHTTGCDRSIGDDPPAGCF